MDLSVVICTYNRADYLSINLDKLSKQITDYKYHVLIIDNNSKDHTKQVAENYITKKPNIFFYYNERNQGHSYARNKGIEMSKGNLISFLDDDAYVQPNYVEILVSSAKKYPDCMAFGGKLTPKYDQVTKPDWMNKFLYPLIAALDLGEKDRKFPGTKFPIGANMAFRKEVFKEFGQFDPNLGRKGTGLEGGDEKDLFFRMRKKGLRPIYISKMAVNHIIPARRLTKSYIRAQAIGVGTSEKKRLAKESIYEKIRKFFTESIKTGGTFLIAFFYILSFRFSTAWMLLKFRVWVIKGYLK